MKDRATLQDFRSGIAADRVVSGLVASRLFKLKTRLNEKRTIVQTSGVEKSFGSRAFSCGMLHAKTLQMALEHRPTLIAEMKRIELVIEPSAFDRFSQVAKGLNLSDFDVTQVRRTNGSIGSRSQRFYRGREFVLDLVERLRIDLNVADDAATRIAHEFIQSVQPESIAILSLDLAAAVTDEAATRSIRIAAVPSAPAPIAAH